MIDLESKTKLKIFGDKIVPADPVDRTVSLAATVREWNLSELRSIVVSPLDLNLRNANQRLPSAQIGLVFRDRTYLAVDVDRSEYTIIESVLATSERTDRCGGDERPVFSERPLAEEEMMRILKARASVIVAWVALLIVVFISVLVMALALRGVLPSDSFQMLVFACLYFLTPLAVSEIVRRICNPKFFINGPSERVAFENALRVKAE